MIMSQKAPGKVSFTSIISPVSFIGPKNIPLSTRLMSIRQTLWAGNLTRGTLHVLAIICFQEKESVRSRVWSLKVSNQASLSPFCIWIGGLEASRDLVSILLMHHWCCRDGLKYKYSGDIYNIDDLHIIQAFDWPNWLKGQTCLTS